MSEQPGDILRINLLLILKEDTSKSHYVWIKLLSDQTNHQHRKHFCQRCLHGYSSGALLERHIPDCKGMEKRAMRIEVPEEDKNAIQKFTHFLQNYESSFRNIRRL